MSDKGIREIEVKVRVRDLEEVARKLVALGAKISDPISQHDTLYSKGGKKQEYKKMEEGDVIMRIRRGSNGAEFNLKQQCSHENDNLEYETDVSNPDAVHTILGLLGYVPAVEVKKVRRKAKWGQYEVCLDQVEQLGSFVEIEKMASPDANPVAVRGELFAELAQLGLSEKDEEKHGYDTQIELLSRKKYEGI